MTKFEIPALAVGVRNSFGVRNSDFGFLSSFVIRICYVKLHHVPARIGNRNRWLRHLCPGQLAVPALAGTDLLRGVRFARHSIKGLVGKDGILPACECLAGRRHWGPSRFWRLP